MTSGDNARHYVDAHVGGRIRALRRTRGFTQERLAERLGLTFQQVQKYEKGANRVSASRLFEIAAVLDVGVSGFFAGLTGPGDGQTGSPEPRVNHLFDSLSPKHQHLVLVMMQSLSQQA